jgi:hypothetical protein
MAEYDEAAQASTTEATAAVAQSRSGDTAAGPADSKAADAFAGEGERYHVGRRVYRAVETRPYERKPDDPIYRPLQIFSLDPAVSKLEGAVALVNVPYEPLAPGPVGVLLAVDPTDGPTGIRYRAANLEDPQVLIRDGYAPSSSEPRFHQQMVYAVGSLTCAAFKTALGRDIAWGFNRDDRPGDPARLALRPHGANERNAYYDKGEGSISFGYFRANELVAGRNQPGGFVFTCLSHDIIAHEMTHALLDGLRAHFTYPSGPDVLAFHEAIADLVAIFQHFSYKEVLASAIRRTRGKLREAALLTALATQFGHTTGSERPLRTAIDVVDKDGKPTRYGEAQEPHARGAVLTAAVFDAFATVFERKVERYVRLATGGSGVLAEGEIYPDLSVVLADQASKLASQFLAICIRAIDYCPPVDLEFGEFLRAVVTADMDLVPDDPWGYREAWIDAFRARGIYPPDTHSLSEDALLWRPPQQAVPRQEALSFAALRFAGDPARAAGAAELRRQACALGRLVSDPRHMAEFGLCRNGDERLGRDTVDPPCIDSIRTSRRVGPDGQLVFDLVAEVTQRRSMKGRKRFDHYGGATVIMDPRGSLRYVIRKSAMSDERLDRQRAFMAGAGKRFWEYENARWVPRSNAFQLLHGGRPPRKLDDTASTT